MQGEDKGQLGNDGHRWGEEDMMMMALPQAGKDNSKLYSSSKSTHQCSTQESWEGHDSGAANWEQH
jgi:hypothetical protein